MSNWILTLLIISTVLGCWCFSLVLRLLSEFIARKRQALRSEREPRDIQRALIAIALLIAGSALSAWKAIDVTRSMTDYQLDDAGIVLAIASGLAIFSAMLSVWALIGDRSRGRLRCPKCWYNMEGIDTPQCPECGKAIKSARHLRQARRMKWPFVLSMLCLGTAIYGLVSLKRIEETSYMALVPTRVLMIGWNILPDSWISRVNGSAYPGCLQDRLMRDWVSVSGKDQFGRSLIRSMPRNKATRWNEHRALLLATVYNNDYTWLRYDDRQHPKPSDTIDYAPLMRLLALDVLHAFTTNTPDAIDRQIVNDFSDYGTHPYNLVWTWMVYTSGTYTENERFPGRFFTIEYQASPVNHAYVAMHMTDILPSFQDPSFLELIHDDRKHVREAAFRLAIDTGLIDADPLVFFEADDQLQLRNSKIQQYLGRVLHLISPEAQEIAFSTLTEWIDSTDAQKRIYAISSILYVQNNVGFNRQTDVPAYHRCVQLMLETSMEDDRTPYTDKTSISIRNLALSVINRYDTRGDLYFPHQRRAIERGNTTTLSRYWYTSDHDSYAESAKLWYDQFSALTESTDAKTRLWIVKNMPPMSGTTIDDDLNAIAAMYLHDQDPEVRTEAYLKLQSRDAIHLVPENYTPPVIEGSL
jgi:hypothetical protein